MKKTLLFLFLAASLQGVFAQQNLKLVSQLDYVSLLNDIWGFEAPDGTEYALVGMRSGVSIVSLADPANPVELQFIPGGQSAWRDLKTWGYYAYITTDQPGTKDGVLVIDLSTLPGTVQYFNWTPLIQELGDTLFTCHNLYIDELGYAYLAGCNLNSGGIIFLDVFSQPGVPSYAGKCQPVYSHDAYVRNNRLYSSEILKGEFAIYDVTDKDNPVLLASQSTPRQFTHNAWLNDAGTVLFTTDEKANASTAAYDISDPGNIRFLDAFYPPATLETGVIPHNVHVLNDYLVISHYTDGCIVVDASRPDNLVQVGQYDTSPGFINGFHGAWGAYPFFSSGLVAVSDIENGLFILQPEYKRACWLEGKITDKNTGAPVMETKVRIQSVDPNLAVSGSDGVYKTGQAMAGIFEVTFQAKGYFDATAQAVLVNGQVTILDMQLMPLPFHTLDGKVQEKITAKPIEGATVFIENADFKYTATTDAGGNFTLPGVLIGDYSVYVGRWGFENGYSEKLKVDGNKVLFYELGLAYEDNFNTDLGWQVTGDATDGHWERGVPLGTSFGGQFFNPSIDSPTDAGPRSYVTGNQGLLVNDDDLDGGATILTSPAMQLRSRYNRPLISYDTWFFEPDGNVPGDDTLVVLVENGKTRVRLEMIDSNVQQWRPSRSFDLVKFIEITDTMRIIFRTSDYNPNYHFLEAGVDNFKVTEGIPDENFVVKDDLVKIRVYPNPYYSEFQVDYKIEKSFEQLSLVVVNVLGQIVEEVQLQEAIGTITLNPHNLVAAPYFVTFRVDGKLSKAVKVVKGW